MAINDPQAIRYMNEVVRPLCEKVRALTAEIAAARVTYDAQVGTFFFNHGGEQVEDGRANEGVPRNSGNDVLDFVAKVLYDGKTALDAAGAAVSKLCVRPLEAH